MVDVSTVEKVKQQVRNAQRLVAEAQMLLGTIVNIKLKYSLKVIISGI